jgi:hypothetical protein
VTPAGRGGPAGLRSGVGLLSDRVRAEFNVRSHAADGPHDARAVTWWGAGLYACSSQRIQRLHRRDITRRLAAWIRRCGRRIDQQ